MTESSSVLLPVHVGSWEPIVCVSYQLPIQWGPVDSLVVWKWPLECIYNNDSCQLLYMLRPFFSSFLSFFSLFSPFHPFFLFLSFSSLLFFLMSTPLIESYAFLWGNSPYSNSLHLLYITFKQRLKLDTDTLVSVLWPVGKFNVLQISLAILSSKLHICFFTKDILRNLVICLAKIYIYCAFRVVYFSHPFLESLPKENKLLWILL